MLDRDAVDPATIRFFQVNLPAKHIVESVLEECAAIGLRRGAFAAHLAELGYCGPPMALIGLDRIVRSERLAPGERIVSFVTEVSKFMQAGYAVRCRT
jgi:3-oxoacyl-[acyl-carrier-protein] synthase III